MAKLIDITGKAIPGEWGTEDTEGTGIPVLRTTNFTNDGVVDYSDVVTRAITKKSINEKYLRYGDIVIEKSGGSDKQPVGRVIFFQGNENTYLFNNFTGLLRVKEPSKWYPRYVFYALFANYKTGGTRRFENKTTGLHNLKTDDYVTSFDVKDNSLEVQMKICSILDQTKELINKSQKQLIKLDDLVKARFVEMFDSFDLAKQKTGWVPISQVGTVVGGSTPKTTVTEYWNGDYRWISPAELKHDSGVIFDSIKKITRAGIDSCSLQELPIGTVILSSRAPIGKVAIAGTTMYCNQGFKNIICGNRVIPRYLYSLLLFNTEYLNSLGRGATFKELSKSIVESIRIPLPEIKLQIQFEEFCKQIDKSKVVVQKALLRRKMLEMIGYQEYFVCVWLQGCHWIIWKSSFMMLPPRKTRQFRRGNAVKSWVLSLISFT